MPEQDDQQSAAADTFDSLHGGGASQEPVADAGTEEREGGQRSTVQNLADAGEPVSDSQAVAGQPSDEPGEVQEGGVGPNSIPPENAERTGLDHRGKAAPEGGSARGAEAAGDRDDPRG